MAMTLVEAEKLSNDELLKGVIETIITESDVLKKLPFVDIVGNGLTYNRESTLPGASFYNVGEPWAESTPTFTQHTATLKILGGDADVDEFLRKTRSNIQDLQAIVTEEKSKAVARTFEDNFIYGSVASNPKGFDGLHSMVDSTMLIHAGSSTTGAQGNIAKLRKLCNLIKPGRPDALIMNQTMADYLTAYAERDESPIQFSPSEWGKRILHFSDIPILICDWITQTEAIASSTFSAKTGGLTTSIFAVKLGEKSLAGCQNGGITVEPIGTLESKDASRVRIKWYVSLACFNTLSLARYDGITETAWAA